MSVFPKGVSSDLVLGADDFYFTRIGDGESITSRGRKTVVDQERRVTLECAVSDARQIGFRWSMNGISLHNSSRRYQIGSNLYFSRIERDEDAGEYSCVATNFSSGHSKTSAPMSMSVICKSISSIAYSPCFFAKEKPTYVLI